jgi:seryl-tRNA synthetase
MLDIKIIRNNPDLVKDNIAKRNLKLNLDEFLEVDQKKLDYIVKVDELRALKNKVSKEIPTLSNEEKPSKIAEMKKVSDDLKVLEQEQKEIEDKWKELYYQVPNLLDDSAAI